MVGGNPRHALSCAARSERVHTRVIGLVGATRSRAVHGLDGACSLVSDHQGRRAPVKNTFGLCVLRQTSYGATSSSSPPALASLGFYLNPLVSTRDCQPDDAPIQLYEVQGRGMVAARKSGVESFLK